MISNYIHTTFPSSPLSSFIHVSCLFGFRVYSVTYHFFFFLIEVQVVKRNYEVTNQHLFNKKNQLQARLWAKKVDKTFVLHMLAGIMITYPIDSQFCIKFVYVCIILSLK